MKLEGVFRPVKLMTRHQEQRGKALFVETSINRDLLTESFSYSGLVTNFYAAAAACCYFNIASTFSVYDAVT